MCGRLSFFWDKTQFCCTVLYDIIVILVIFAAHLFDRIKCLVNEILLVLTDRPTLFVKTVWICDLLSQGHNILVYNTPRLRLKLETNQPNFLG